MHRRVGRALALSAFSMLWLLDPSGLTRLEATVTQAVAVERIVGSWRVRIVGEGSDTPLFAVATATSDRTVVITGGIPTASVGHGLWRKLASGRFVVKFLYFRFDDETGALIGSAAVESKVSISRTADGVTASGTGQAILFDLDGVEVETLPGEVTAERLRSVGFPPDLNLTATTGN